MKTLLTLLLLISFAHSIELDETNTYILDYRLLDETGDTSKNAAVTGDGIIEKYDTLKYRYIDEDKLQPYLKFSNEYLDTLKFLYDVSLRIAITGEPRGFHRTEEEAKSWLPTEASKDVPYMLNHYDRICRFNRLEVDVTQPYNALLRLMILRYEAGETKHVLTIDKPIYNSLDTLGRINMYYLLERMPGHHPSSETKDYKQAVYSKIHKYSVGKYLDDDGYHRLYKKYKRDLDECVKVYGDGSEVITDGYILDTRFDCMTSNDFTSTLTTHILSIESTKAYWK